MDDAHGKTVSGTIARYACSKYYRQGLGIVTSLLRPKLLAPEYYGIWTLIKLVSQYASYAHLGTQSAMRYMLPLYRARGDDEYSEALQDSALAGGLVANLALSMLAAVLAILPIFSPVMRAGLGTMAVLILFRYYHEYLIAVLRAEEAFGAVTRATYVYVTTAFVTTIPLLYYLGIYGLYVSLLLTYAVTIIFLLRVYAFRCRLRIRGDVLRKLAGKGFPLILMSFTVLLVVTSDRLVVTIFLGKEHLGYYGIALLVMNFLINIPGTAREVMEPRLMKSVEGADASDVAEEFLATPLLNTAYLMPFLIGPVYLGLPAGIRLVLPRYAQGIASAQLLAVGVFFLALAYAPRILIVAKNWQVQACGLLPPVLLVNLGLSIALVKKGYGLSGVALASSLSYALLFMVLLGFLRVKMSGTGVQWGVLTKQLAFPFSVMCILIVAFSVFCRAWPGPDLLGAGIATVLYLGLMAIVYRAASRRIGNLKHG